MKGLLFSLTILLAFCLQTATYQDMTVHANVSAIDGRCDLNGFRTQTMGGWGASPSGDNPGTYLHNHFGETFGTGVTIGYGSNTVTFTSAQAITDFLPSGGTPSSIKKSYINPSTKKLSNTLVSQVLALTLSVNFDRTDADFSSSYINLANLSVASGEFQGESVGNILDIANRTLAGEDTGYSASQINDAVSAINENFVDGGLTGYYLTCPVGRF